MSDVPADIREAARAVVERGYDEGLLEAVEHALMAERLAQKERDAKIADDIERRQDDDNGAANTGGAAEAAAAIRRGN